MKIRPFLKRVGLHILDWELSIRIYKQGPLPPKSGIFFGAFLLKFETTFLCLPILIDYNLGWRSPSLSPFDLQKSQILNFGCI